MGRVEGRFPLSLPCARPPLVDSEAQGPVPKGTGLLCTRQDNRMKCFGHEVALCEKVSKSAGR